MSQNRKSGQARAFDATMIISIVLTASFYFVMYLPSMRGSILQHYTTEHVVEYVIVWLFAWGIIDIALKRSHGVDLIRDLHLRYPSLRMFVHSAHTEELYAPLCFHMGARGYMNKGEDVQTIVHAIRTILDGNIYLSARMLKWFTSCAMTKETVEPRHPLNSLSPRELQVFEMLGRGLDIKEIADQLTLDHKTVEMYRQRIRAKLNVPSSQAVHRIAILWNNSPDGTTDTVSS